MSILIFENLRIFICCCMVIWKFKIHISSYKCVQTVKCAFFSKVASSTLGHIKCHAGNKAHFKKPKNWPITKQSHEFSCIKNFLFDLRRRLIFFFYSFEHHKRVKSSWLNHINWALELCNNSSKSALRLPNNIRFAEFKGSSFPSMIHCIGLLQVCHLKMQLCSSSLHRSGLIIFYILSIQIPVNH